MKTFYNIQSYILNISFPSSLSELVNKIVSDKYMDIEAIINNIDYIWTAPKWASSGDIIFFTHAKTAISKISKLENEYNRKKENFGKDQQSILNRCFGEARRLYKEYNGKIFAYCQIKSAPFYFADEQTSQLHWKSRIYVNTSDIELLKYPINIDECKDFIQISKMSSITPLFGKNFEELKRLIISSNSITEYFRTAIATPFPLINIDSDNWISISNYYRRKFIYEAQFRHYYVDYFLKEISDRKKIYKECRCKKDDINDSFIDNVIYIKGKYLPVEVKLNIASEKDLRGQIRKYCNNTSIELEKSRIITTEDIFSQQVLIIDTNEILLYNYSKDSFERLNMLDKIQSSQNIVEERNKLLALLN